jgi:hypothetical protein
MESASMFKPHDPEHSQYVDSQGACLMCKSIYLGSEVNKLLLQIDGVKKIVDTYFKSRKPHADICGCWACEIRKVLLPIEKPKSECERCCKHPGEHLPCCLHSTAIEKRIDPPQNPPPCACDCECHALAAMFDVRCQNPKCQGKVCQK